ncbi:TPA: 30S ribosomal protein S17 [Candidatus Dependentiae bacterium]|nr:MAG: 30S ribosomal protein S17 [candidate division TM6 bacterium GW2011_GWF2_43_87]HBL98457.1 30S ribosomal protein S17 [Candidatus Dependentiae bacterium]
MTDNTKAKKTLVGYVVSDDMQKTIVVSIPRSYIHPTYKKVVRTEKKYKVHDEQEAAHVGDRVEICEGRHMSKTKYMHLVQVIETKSGR